MLSVTWDEIEMNRNLEYLTSIVGLLHIVIATEKKFNRATPSGGNGVNPGGLNNRSTNSEA